MRSTSRRRRRPPRRRRVVVKAPHTIHLAHSPDADDAFMFWALAAGRIDTGDRRYVRSEEHTSELQSQSNLVCRLLLEKKKKSTHSARHSQPSLLQSAHTQGHLQRSD